MCDLPDIDMDEIRMLQYPRPTRQPQSKPAVLVLFEIGAVSRLNPWETTVLTEIQRDIYRNSVSIIWFDKA